MTPAARREIFARLQAADPTPRTELDYATPFQLLVAVILSAQATDKSVNRATASLFRDAPTPAAMLALGVGGLSRYIQSIGLYNTKARNVIETCRILVERFGGEVPARSRIAGVASRCGPQDGERGAQCRVRRADDRGRHAHFPRGQPPGPRARPNAA